MSPPPSSRRAALEPPQFRLRTLLWLVTGCCVLVALFGTLDAYGIFAVVLFVLAVIAHVAGASLGHRLRDLGDKPLPPPAKDEDHFRPVEPHEYAPATKLSKHRRLGWLVISLTVTGLVVGAASGSVLLVLLNGSRANVTNVASGATGFAVLGGIAGFAMAAFGQEVMGAMWEAQKWR